MAESIKPIKISVILPCRNEEESLAGCLKQILAVLTEQNINGEIIVSDSSTDRSPEIARQYRVKLVKHDQIGYGRAYQEGFQAATGDIFFMADPDGSYDFRELPRFLDEFNRGYDLILGDRFAGTMDRKSMPWLHRYLGQPIFSSLFRFLFHCKVKDIHSGMRLFSRATWQKLELQSSGMELASEMIIKATKLKLKIKELPINYQPRQGRSKLKTFRDGWRHLRLILYLSLLKSK